MLGFKMVIQPCVCIAARKVGLTGLPVLAVYSAASLCISRILLFLSFVDIYDNILNSHPLREPFFSIPLQRYKISLIFANIFAIIFILSPKSLFYEFLKNIPLTPPMLSSITISMERNSLIRLSPTGHDYYS